MENLSFLKDIQLLKDMPEEQLKKISAITQFQEYESGKILFKQNQKPDFFYLLFQGRVLLSSTSSSGIELPVGIVYPGSCFGISALILGRSSSAKAETMEKSTLIQLPEKELSQLLNSDTTLGYILMLQLVKAFKAQMNQRTKLFLRCLEKNPDFRTAIAELDTKDKI